MNQPGPTEQKLLTDIAAGEAELARLTDARGEARLAGEPVDDATAEIDALTAYLAGLREQLPAARRKDQSTAADATRRDLQATVDHAKAGIGKAAGLAPKIAKAADALVAALAEFQETLQGVSERTVFALSAAAPQEFQRRLIAGRGGFQPASTAQAIVEGVLANVAGRLDLRVVQATAYATDVAGMTQQLGDRFLQQVQRDVETILTPPAEAPAAVDDSDQFVDFPGQGRVHRSLVTIEPDRPRSGGPRAGGKSPTPAPAPAPTGRRVHMPGMGWRPASEVQFNSAEDAAAFGAVFDDGAQA